MIEAPEKPGIARTTPCSCASAAGMWDRAGVDITASIRGAVEDDARKAIERWRRIVPERGLARDVEAVTNPERWEEDVRIGFWAEEAFARLIGARRRTGGKVDVEPDWDVKFSREMRLWITEKRGRDELRYAFASGDADRIWFYGFATGAGVRERGYPGVRFKEPGHWLDVDGLHRLPADPRLHKPTPS